MGGQLGWAPPAVYASTIPEIVHAYRGFLIGHGIDPDKETNAPEPMTADDINEFDARIKAIHHAKGHFGLFPKEA